MPPRRQLPWANKAGGSRPRVQQPPAERSVPSDTDDDFFDGTVLQSSRKGRDRADAQNSDSELPELPSKFSRHSRKDGSPSRGSRMPSSSPPPIAADQPPPETEFMLTGLDKFDLRDDEWMMVEDELLQTAKSFSQHLHLAEYEKLKAKMEEKRKQATARPVVQGAKPSVEGHFKRKAEEQARSQKKAIREVSSSTRDDSNAKDQPPERASTSRITSSLASTRPSNTARVLDMSRNISNPSVSDSDDLDAPKRPAARITSAASFTPPNTISSMTHKSRTTAPSAATFQPPMNEHPGKDTDVFAKPAAPAKTRMSLARPRRPNLWDDWDELNANPEVPTAEPSSPKSTQASTRKEKVALPTTKLSSSSPNLAHAPATVRTEDPLPNPSKRSSTALGLDDLATPKRSRLAQETAERLAKRRADKERDDKGKSSKYDDIPTFLF